MQLHVFCAACSVISSMCASNACFVLTGCSCRAVSCCAAPDVVLQDVVNEAVKWGGKVLLHQEVGLPAAGGRSTGGLWVFGHGRDCDSCSMCLQCCCRRESCVQLAAARLSHQVLLVCLRPTCCTCDCCCRWWCAGPAADWYSSSSGSRPGVCAVGQHQRGTASTSGCWVLSDPPSRPPGSCSSQAGRCHGLASSSLADNSSSRPPAAAAAAAVQCRLCDSSNSGDADLRQPDPAGGSSSRGGGRDHHRQCSG